MNISKPEDTIFDESQVEVAVANFEIELGHEDKGEDYYHLVIDGELSEPLCEEITRLYKEAGWGDKTICRTSSKNGERPGLTGLHLYRGNSTIL